MCLGGLFRSLWLHSVRVGMPLSSSAGKAASITGTAQKLCLHLLCNFASVRHVLRSILKSSSLLNVPS